MGRAFSFGMRVSAVGVGHPSCAATWALIGVLLARASPAERTNASVPTRAHQLSTRRLRGIAF
jgi:hypothetical protein